jgi:3'(2'), 5'-bisphosphate nucleotidase
MKTPYQPLLEEVLQIAKIAGGLIMDIYQVEVDVSSKADGSPVTLADQVADDLIVGRLNKLTPQIPVISEESTSLDPKFTHANTFWLVDPLDGTKEFISKNDQFTVNIALIEHGQPVLGVVYAPAKDCLYAGTQALAFLEKGGIRTAIACRPIPDEGLTVLGSRSHRDEQALNRFLHGMGVYEILAVGSSLKFCLIAAGQADLYPRLGRTMEWDIAAGHAVLQAAGGLVHDLHGKSLQYGKPGFENPHFVASSTTITS